MPGTTIYDISSHHQKRRRRCENDCQQHKFSLKHSQIESKYDIEMQFCPKYNRGGQNETTYPEFNTDKRYYTSCFILGMQKKDIDRYELDELKEHQQQVNETKEKQCKSVFPKPNKKHTLCSVCKVTYDNYRKHIFEDMHIIKVKQSSYTKYIHELCEYFRNEWEGLEEIADQIALKEMAEIPENQWHVKRGKKDKMVANDYGKESGANFIEEEINATIDYSDDWEEEKQRQRIQLQQLAIKEKLKKLQEQSQRKKLKKKNKKQKRLQKRRQVTQSNEEDEQESEVALEKYVHEQGSRKKVTTNKSRKVEEISQSKKHRSKAKSKTKHDRYEKSSSVSQSDESSSSREKSSQYSDHIKLKKYKDPKGSIESFIKRRREEDKIKLRKLEKQKKKAQKRNHKDKEHGHSHSKKKIVTISSSSSSDDRSLESSSQSEDGSSSSSSRSSSSSSIDSELQRKLRRKLKKKLKEKKLQKKLKKKLKVKQERKRREREEAEEKQKQKLKSLKRSKSKQTASSNNNAKDTANSTKRSNKLQKVLEFKQKNKAPSLQDQNQNKITEESSKKKSALANQNMTDKKHPSSTSASSKGKSTHISNISSTAANKNHHLGSDKKKAEPIVIELDGEEEEGKVDWKNTLRSDTSPAVQQQPHHEKESIQKAGTEKASSVNQNQADVQQTLNHSKGDNRQIQQGHQNLLRREGSQKESNGDKRQQQVPEQRQTQVWTKTHAKADKAVTQSLINEQKSKDTISCQQKASEISKSVSQQKSNRRTIENSSTKRIIQEGQVGEKIVEECEQMSERKNIGQQQDHRNEETTQNISSLSPTNHFQTVMSSSSDKREDQNATDKDSTVTNKQQSTIETPQSKHQNLLKLLEPYRKHNKNNKFNQQNQSKQISHHQHQATKPTSIVQEKPQQSIVTISSSSSSVNGDKIMSRSQKEKNHESSTVQVPTQVQSNQIQRNKRNKSGRSQKPSVPPELVINLEQEEQKHPDSTQSMRQSRNSNQKLQESLLQSNSMQFSQSMIHNNPQSKTSDQSDPFQGVPIDSQLIQHSASHGFIRNSESVKSTHQRSNTQKLQQNQVQPENQTMNNENFRKHDVISPQPSIGSKVDRPVKQPPKPASQKATAKSQGQLLDLSFAYERPNSIIRLQRQYNHMLEQGQNNIQLHIQQQMYSKNHKLPSHHENEIIGHRHDRGNEDQAFLARIMENSIPYQKAN